MVLVASMTFRLAGPKVFGAKDKKVAWILIEKEYQGGFRAHIDLLWGQSNVQ